MDKNISHFIKTKTSIKDRSMLKRALTKMGLTVQEGSFIISQYGTSEQAEICLEDRALGFQQQKDGTFMLVGDPYHCTNQKLRKYYGRQEQFELDIRTTYNVLEATEQLESMNFTCVENSQGTVGKNGKIKMIFESVIG